MDFVELLCILTLDYGRLYKKYDNEKFRGKKFYDYLRLCYNFNNCNSCLSIVRWRIMDKNSNSSFK